jgi:hypothetical protein
VIFPFVFPHRHAWQKYLLTAVKGGLLDFQIICNHHSIFQIHGVLPIMDQQGIEGLRISCFLIFLFLFLEISTLKKDRQLNPEKIRKQIHSELTSSKV